MRKLMRTSVANNDVWRYYKIIGVLMKGDKSVRASDYISIGIYMHEIIGLVLFPHLLFAFVPACLSPVLLVSV